jgi:hypothetical protein
MSHAGYLLSVLPASSIRYDGNTCTYHITVTEERIEEFRRISAFGAFHYALYRIQAQIARHRVARSNNG